MVLIFLNWQHFQSFLTQENIHLHIASLKIFEFHQKPNNLVFDLDLDFLLDNCLNTFLKILIQTSIHLKTDSKNLVIGLSHKKVDASSLPD